MTCESRYYLRNKHKTLLEFLYPSEVTYIGETKCTWAANQKCSYLRNCEKCLKLQLSCELARHSVKVLLIHLAIHNQTRQLRPLKPGKKINKQNKSKHMTSNVVKLTINFRFLKNLITFPAGLQRINSQRILLHH